MSVETDINKITRVILQVTKELVLKMHVKLLHENEGRKENFHKLFIAPNGNKYLNLDIQAFLTLELKRDEWSIDKWIIISQNNIIHIIKGFKKILKAIYEKEIFAMNNSGEIIIYKDMVKKYTQKIYNLSNNNRILISPAIIYDENEISYEGVILYLNKMDNYVELSIDAFESLLYVLEKIDIFIYSQNMLNYFMAYTQGNQIQTKETIIQKSKYNKKSHPLINQQKEEVKGNLYKKQSAEEIFQFNIDKSVSL